ncbi:MAG: NUDIX domain-containing protein [Methanomassiliicoccaceae archaeon]|nr:NUDIX domain-containing protein [Methanomassiliicoccaceae archaeon]
MMTVYTIAFLGGEFLMVFNPKRNGWEMPGGRTEEGESIIEAAEREFAEEAGYAIDVISTKRIDDCHVCAAYLLGKIGSGEFTAKMFSEVPEDLAFGRSEYNGVLEWARSAVAAELPFV